MPIFESGEPITTEELQRQQKDLDEKVKRKDFAESYDNMVTETFGHDGGDSWETEKAEQEFNEALEWLQGEEDVEV